MQNIIPAVTDITAAAKASSQTSPRWPRAFLVETIRALAELHPRAVRGVAVTRGWCSGDATPGVVRRCFDRRLNGDGVPAFTEADMRGVFVELFIYAAPDEDDARRRWGAVFGLCEEAT